MVSVEPFHRSAVTIVAHYSLRKGESGTDQWQDCCLQAGILEPVDLRLDWVPTSGWAETLKVGGKPLIAVQLPRRPMDRGDGFGGELLPNCDVIQSAIDLIGNRADLVQIGSGTPLYQFSGIDIDLANKTTVPELIDVGQACDAFLGYVSFIVPLAESMRKPSLLVWSRRGVNSSQEFIRALTPQKVLHRKSSAHVFDDCTHGELAVAVDALLEQARGQAAVRR